jgi:hypothetical protein
LFILFIILFCFVTIVTVNIQDTIRCCSIHIIAKTPTPALYLQVSDFVSYLRFISESEERNNNEDIEFSARDMLLE